MTRAILNILAWFIVALALAGIPLLIFAQPIPSVMPLAAEIDDGESYIETHAGSYSWNPVVASVPVVYRFRFENAFTNQDGLTPLTVANVWFVLGVNRFMVRSENATNTAQASAWTSLDVVAYETNAIIRQPVSGPTPSGPWTNDFAGIEASTNPRFFSWLVEKTNWWGLTAN